MRTLVVAHSSPAEVRAQQLFGSCNAVRVVRPGAGWRGGLRALWALSTHRPKVVYLVDVGLSTALAGVAARVTRRHVIVDTGDLVYKLERSRGERSHLGLAAVFVGERLALSSAHHIVVRGQEHQRVLAGKSTTFAPDLAPPRAEPRDGAPIRAQLGLEGCFVVGLVGTLRLAPRLGVCYGWDLVEALAKTPESVVGLIVGSGEGIEILRARAAELGVSGRCVTVGPVPSDEVATWIGAMDVALSTQSNDDVGAVRTTGKLPLYLACGCPVLASHVGEAARLLGPLGWTLPYQGVVDRTYPRRLAGRISLWASEPARMRERRQTARRLYERAFNENAIRGRVLELLDAPVAVINSTAQVGGAELSLLPVLAELVHRRRVVVFLPASGPLEERLAAIGVEVAAGFELHGALSTASGTYGGPYPLTMVLGAVRQQWALERSLRRLKPAVVYCNGVRAQVGGTLPAWVAGASVVWHVRDFGRPGLLGRVWRLLASRPARVIANSHATAAQSGLRRAREVSVVHNGIDLDVFRPRTCEPPGPLVIGMAGHLTPWKGHQRFVRLLAELRRELPTVQGRIAGNAVYDTDGHGELGEAIVQAGRRHGVDEALRIESLSPEEMPAWFGRLHVLVHCPEAPEPFGRVLAEALAIGVPVVSSSGGGAREVVGPAGRVVPPNDENALHAAVLDLLLHPEHRRALAEMGPARAASEFEEGLYAGRVADSILEFG